MPGAVVLLFTFFAWALALTLLVGCDDGPTSHTRTCIDHADGTATCHTED
jgi:hypothetical protein